MVVPAFPFVVADQGADPVRRVPLAIRQQNPPAVEPYQVSRVFAFARNAARLTPRLTSIIRSGLPHIIRPPLVAIFTPQRSHETATW